MMAMLTIFVLFLGSFFSDDEDSFLKIIWTFIGAYVLGQIIS